jgi:hypothetical protein
MRSDRPYRKAFSRVVLGDEEVAGSQLDPGLSTFLSGIASTSTRERPSR